MAPLRDPQWLQVLLGAAEILLLGLAVVVTVWQFSRTRASSYIERFNGRDMLECRGAVDRWLQTNSTDAERLEALRVDPMLSVQLKQFANLFQELGAAYQFRVADRRTVEVLFDTLIMMYWERLRFWVHDYRASVDPTLYSRFEGLYKAVEARSRKRPKPEYVLVYGSLMALDSAGRGIGRAMHPDELIPVTLVGFRRTWSVGEQVRFRGDGQEATAVFLDVTRDESAEVRALMFAVTRREKKRLMRREKNYSLVEVSDDLRLSDGRAVARNIAAFCFVGRDEYRVHVSDDHAVILNDYLERVAEAASFATELPGEIRDSAARSGFRRVSEAYRFVDPVQASLV